MPCYKPLQGFRSALGRGISFNPTTGYVDQPMSVPCGQCIGCRLERARQWAVRCQHESTLHPLKCFVTLTYDDEHLPADLSLKPKHLQDFFKRLRKHHPGLKISYLACGEYGDTTLRPHYHALLFGIDFPDKLLYKKGENALYRSDTLSRIWGHGFCSIGTVSFESASYVARYSVKKVTGKPAESHYRGRVPEFLRASSKPAIGRRWIEKFTADTYPSDTVISRGFEAKPPAYYDKVLKLNNPGALESVKHRRRQATDEPKARRNATPARLATRETVTKAKLNLKGRTL